MIGNESHSLRGYKQTEIGEIPEDWKLKTFGEIFDFKSTASNSRSDLTKSDSTHYIHYGDIHTVFHRHLNLEKRETPMISQELCKNASLVRNGDWVMADASEDYSGICKAIEISGISEEKSVVAGLHTFLLRDREGAYVPGFKGHLGEAKYLHDQYVRVSVGLKVFGVTKTSLRDLLIPVPPKIEQSRIEKMLTDSDSQIQALELLISKKRDIKQATMQELLTGKTRLPGHSGVWESKILENTATLNARIGWQGLTTEEYLDYGDFLLVGGTEFNDGFVDWKSCFFVEETRFKQDKKIQLREDDVLVTKDGTIGKVALVQNLPMSATLNSGVFVIRSKKGIFHARFFYYLLLSRVFIDFLNRLVAGSTINHLYQKDFVDFEFHLPPTIEEQQAIAEILSDMDAEIATLEKRLEKAKAIKKGMMQQLLTGRIRLVDSSTPQEARV